jgi:predicted phage tail protein
MANAFKNAGAAVAASRTDIYTCPAATEAVIHAVYLSNVDGVSSVDATVEVYDSSAATYYHVGKTLPVPADSTLVLDKPINLNASDKLTVTASAASDLECFISVLEIT